MKDVIYGRPESEYEYEFCIVEKTEDGYKWIKDYDDYYWYAQEIEKLLSENPNYILCHNVRIHHKEQRNG